MKLARRMLIVALLLVAVIPASAKVVFTPLNVSVPVNGSYPIDLNHDGVADFTLQTELVQDYCQFGDGYIWSLSVVPARGNAVVADSVTLAPAAYADALLIGQPVDSSRRFYPDDALLADLSWGSCGTGVLGGWLNLPNRYLGLQFHGASANEIHYAWAKMSVAAYVDQHGRLQASIILSGFAYETVSGKGIMTGQTSD